MEQKEGIGEVFGRFWRGIVSLLSTGSWHVEEVADRARSAEMVLDRVDEAVEHDAQVTLDNIDDAPHQLQYSRAKSRTRGEDGRAVESESSSSLPGSQEVCRRDSGAHQMGRADHAGSHREDTGSG